MKKYLVLGPLVLLVVLLAACATPEQMANIRAEETQTAQVWQATSVANAVNTVVAAGTPMPTWTPTPIPPIVTPTPTGTPSPTATPFTGIKLYDNDGKTFVQDMPPGYQPTCTGWWGCPGELYMPYVNGTPVPDAAQHTSGNRPFLLIGIPAFLLFFGILSIGIYQATAPSRERARMMRAMTKAHLQSLSARRMRSLPAPTDEAVSTKEFSDWCMEYLYENPDKPLQQYLLKSLVPIGYQRTIPMAAAIDVLRRYDEQHATNVVALFSAFLMTRYESRGDHANA